MPTTPLFAAVFTLIYLALSVDIARQRWQKRVVLGDGEDRNLQRSIRAHANFIEYVPLALLMLWFVESVLYIRWLVPILLIILLVGRIAHILGIKQPRQFFWMRTFGMCATWFVLLACVTAILMRYVPL